MAHLRVVLSLGYAEISQSTGQQTRKTSALYAGLRFSFSFSLTSLWSALILSSGGLVSVSALSLIFYLIIMTTTELLSIIGEPVGSIIIAPPYGNAHIHKNGFFSCDPCYLWKYGDHLRGAWQESHPWETYDYKLHREQWTEFQFVGQKCWSRDCSDGIGYFGNTVDAGYVFVFPHDLAPEFMKGLATQQTV